MALPDEPNQPNHVIAAPTGSASISARGVSALDTPALPSSRDSEAHVSNGLRVAPGQGERLNPVPAATASTWLDAALGWSALGIDIVPIDKGCKWPQLPGWEQIGHPSDAQIRQWDASGKYAGIGIRPGAQSGNIVILDTDDLISDAAFCARFPELLDTYTERSGGGIGRHRVYRPKRLPQHHTTKIKRSVLLDGQVSKYELFFDSGQVVVAPSLHPSGGHYRAENELPILDVEDLDEVIAWIYGLPSPNQDETADAPTEPQRPAVPTKPGAHRAYALKALDGMFADVARLTDVVNDFQNDACHVAVWKGAHYVARGDATESEVFSGAEGAMRSNGYIGAFGYSAFKKTFDSGFRSGLTDSAYVPKCYQEGFTARKLKKSVRRRLEKQAAAHTDAIRVAHVSDDLTPAEIAQHSTLLIQAPTGLGKSTAVTAWARTLSPDQYITAMAQFRLLTSALHRLLADFAHYEQADGAHQRVLGKLQRLVTSLSSLAKFDRHGGRVIIDEITGVLKFLAESSTFQGGEALAAYRALVRLLETAVQLVGMDANLDDITIRFVEEHRGKVSVKRYQRAETRGQVMLLRDKIAAIRMIEKLLSHRRGQVFAPCSSEATTAEITEHFTARGYRVLKVTRDTSNTERVKSAIRDAALRAGYDLIAYDSACGAGVDFPELLYAQVAVFDRVPLAPEDAIQLFGRVRNAKRRYAAVPGDGEGYSTPTADELLTDVLKRERWSANYRKATPQDRGDMLELAQLWAQFKARQLRETARWRYYFAQRLQMDGFTVAENNARASEAFAEAWKQWRADRDDQRFAFVLNAVDQALPEDDLDRLRLSGVEITTELNLRNVRWHIETAKADPEVTDQDRDLMKAHGRRRLFHLRDWFSDAGDLHAVDEAQADEEYPIHRRRYSTLTHAVIAELFKLMGHKGDPEQQLMGFIASFKDSTSRADVEARYGMVTSPQAMSKFKALGHYGNNAVTATGLCRWLFEYFGLKLNSKRGRADGNLSMFYQVDAETLDYRLDRARTAASRRERVIRNVYSSLKYTKVITPAATSVTLWPDAPTPDYSTPEGEAVLVARVAALTQPMGRW